MRHLQVDGHDEFNALHAAIRAASRDGKAVLDQQGRETLLRILRRLETTPYVPTLAEQAGALTGDQALCEARVPDLSGTSRSGTRVCGVRLVAPGGRCPAVEYHAGT